MSFNVKITASEGDWGGQECDFAEVVPVAARAVQGVFQSHFTRLSVEKSSAWWGDASRAVRTTISGQGAEVEVDYPGVALHYYGGVVEPVEARLLSVPAATQAKGRSPLEFSNLRLVIFPHLCGPSGHLAGMLVQELSASKARAAKSKQKAFRSRAAKAGIQLSLMPGRPEKPKLQPFYWLMDQTTHKPDDGALPSDSDFESGLDRALTGFQVEVER